MTDAPPSSRPLRLKDLPVDILLQVCDCIAPEALYPLSQVSPFWTNFLQTTVWPRRAASLIGVRTILHDTSHLPSLPPLLSASSPDPLSWPRLLSTLTIHPSSRTLHVCVQLSNSDSVTSLALEFGLSRHDIFRANSLLNETHLASRTHLYLPLFDDSAVLQFTGAPISQQSPVLVRDPVLSNKHFLVVKFRPSKETHSKVSNDPAVARRESYVRHLVVKLIAKGLAVDEDEVRFYLDDNDFDVATAYKQLVHDHQFCP